MISRRKVKPDLEFKILGSMIMNKEVLYSAHARYVSGDLKTIHFAQNYRPIFRWLIGYWERYRKPPKQTIQDLFKSRSKKLSSDSAELIEQYLGNLSDDYMEQVEDGIDEEFVKQEVIPEFIKERELDYRAEMLQQRLDAGDLDGAEQAVVEYKKVLEVEEDEELGSFRPLTVESLKKDENDNTREVYRFPNDFGNVSGPLYSSWLVAITGVEKSGKSYLLQEISYDAAIYHKKRVLVINLELNKPVAMERFHRRISKTQIEEDGNIFYPILDCENNQTGGCEIRKRPLNKEPLYLDKKQVLANPVKYYSRPKWKICVKCRFKKDIRKNAALTKRFVPAIWFEKKWIRKLTKARFKKSLRQMKTLPIKNIRIKCFPTFSVTFSEVEDYIYRLIEKLEWKPDIVIFDYLDIFAQEHREIRIDVDQKWKMAKRLAGELDCLVITADQANKAGREKRVLDQMSTTESKTKDSHLDVRIALNQTNEERPLGVARLNVLFHRHRQFDPGREVVITQRLHTGEPLRDQCFTYRKLGRNYPVEAPKN